MPELRSNWAGSQAGICMIGSLGWNQWGRKFKLGPAGLEAWALSAGLGTGTGTMRSLCVARTGTSRVRSLSCANTGVEVITANHSCVEAITGRGSGAGAHTGERSGAEAHTGLGS